MDATSTHGPARLTAPEIGDLTTSLAQRLRALVDRVRTCLRPRASLVETWAAPETRELKDEPLRQVGRWRVIDVLGEGSSATVYRVAPAAEPRSTRQYALKLQSREVASDRSARQRFHRETRVLSSIRHRNIVQLVESGDHEGRAFLVMEMVEGQNLRDALEKQQPKLMGRLDWAIQICRALAAMHGLGIVHRDLKPENILTTRVGGIKVADFGLARNHDTEQVTRAGFLVGTPAYMSPEYLMGHEPDHRSDLYSLGVILYELFTGTVPYPAGSVNEFLQAHLEARPVRPRQRSAAVPHELEEIILRLLEKRPSRRYQTADEVREALETLQAHLVGVEPQARRNVA